MTKKNLEIFLEAYADGKELENGENSERYYGYWNNIKNVIKEAKRIKRKHNLGSLPGTKNLTELGYGYLAAAISNYGGMRSFRTALGEKQKELPKGSWKDKKFVVNEAQRIMRENNLSTLPGGYTLSKRGYSSLAMAIDRYHGGFRKFRQILGQQQMLRKPGLWKNIEYVIKEAKKIKRKHKFKQLPGSETLERLGYSAFLNGIQKYHGGINNLREKLGEKLLRIDSRLIRDESYIINQAKEIMQEENFDYLPASGILYERGYTSFVNAVNRHHSGITSLRKKLNQKEIKKPTGYWEKFSRIKNIIVELERELEHFPTQRDLQQRGYGSVANAITNIHGGINAVREKLGFEIKKRERGYYNPQNIEKEIKKIISENAELEGNLPSAHWLKKNGYSALCAGIGKERGSYRKFREQRGLPANLQVETGKWKDLTFTLEEAKKFMEDKELQEFPGSWTLNKLGYSSLGAAIEKYHQGFPVFREKLYEYVGRKPSTQKLENFLQEYIGGKDND